jgi:hypothetical protein
MKIQERTMRIILTVLLSCALLCACSDDDGDSIEEVCNAKCALDGHPLCSSFHSQCVGTCKILAADADKKYLSGCGLCVANSFSWYDDSSQCYGFQKKTPTDKACVPKCFLPDGGPGY